MKIAVIGASGNTGRHIMHEATTRNLDVTAIVRNKENLKVKHDAVIEIDLFDLTKEHLAPFDIIINAFAPLPGEEHLHKEAGLHLISLLEGTPKRLFVVGSSGLLFINKAKTERLMDREDYPTEQRKIDEAQLANLHDLEQSSIHWSMLNPSAMFDIEGPRTGHYTTGKENIILNSQLNSYISYADYAVVVIDEILNNEHANRAFTAASENITTAS